MATRNGSDPPRPPGLPRRLASIVYDAILLGGVLLLASAVVTIPLGLALGPEKAQPVFASPWFRWPFFLYCVAVAASFHLWFWTHGGQTLGMRAWRLKVVREDGGPLGGRDALARWGAALVSWLPLGLGFLWSAGRPSRTGVARPAFRHVPRAPAQGRRPPRRPGQRIRRSSSVPARRNAAAGRAAATTGLSS